MNRTAQIHAFERAFDTASRLVREHDPKAIEFAQEAVRLSKEIGDEALGCKAELKLLHANWHALSALERLERTAPLMQLAMARGYHPTYAEACWSAAICADHLGYFRAAVILAGECASSRNVANGFAQAASTMEAAIAARFGSHEHARAAMVRALQLEIPRDADGYSEMATVQTLANAASIELTYAKYALGFSCSATLPDPPADLQTATVHIGRAAEMVARARAASVHLGTRFALMIPDSQVKALQGGVDGAVRDLEADRDRMHALGSAQEVLITHQIGHIYRLAGRTAAALPHLISAAETAGSAGYHSVALDAEFDLAQVHESMRNDASAALAMKRFAEHSSRVHRYAMSRLDCLSWIAAIAGLDHERKRAVRSEPSQLKKAIAICTAQESHELSVEQLARAAGASRRKLEVLFRRWRGVSPAQFIRNHWLDEAAVRMGLPGASISKVALDLGFSSASSFSVAFKARFNVTPRQYMRGLQGERAGQATDR